MDTQQLLVAALQAAVVFVRTAFKGVTWQGTGYHCPCALLLCNTCADMMIEANRSGVGVVIDELYYGRRQPAANRRCSGNSPL